MINALKMGHILMPLFLSIVYVYFILLLSRYLYVSIIMVSVYSILMFIYAVRTYSVLHFNPGKAKTLHQNLNCATDKIFQYKRNQEKIRELKAGIKMSIKNKTKDMTQELKRQYAQYYQEPTYCDRCECVRPPRAVHCNQCNACILRREKHSDLLGFCIGQGNLKTYIQYVFIAMVVTVYMITTLISISVGENIQLDDFSNAQLSFFAMEEMILLACFLSFTKQFSISYYNVVENITQTERKQKIIKKGNNPFENQKFYEKLFTSKLDYFKIQQVGDYNHWLEMQEEM